MRKKAYLFALLLFLGTLFFARDEILTVAAELYIKRQVSPHGARVERSKNTLWIRHLVYQTASEEVILEEAKASFHLTFFPLQLNLSLFIPDIELSFAAQQEGSKRSSLAPLAFLIGESRWSSLDLCVEQGRLRHPSGKMFLFDFSSSSRGIGTLVFKDSEQNHLGNVSVQRQGKNHVEVDVAVEKGSLEDLMLLTSLVQRGDWQGKGEVSVQAKASLCKVDPSKGEGLLFLLEKVEGELDLEQAELSIPGFGFQGKTLKGSFLFAPEEKQRETQDTAFWREWELFLTFEESSLYLEQKGKRMKWEDVLGEIRLHPQEDPYVKIGGKISSVETQERGGVIPFELEGKGEVLEKGAYWVQAQMNFFSESSVEPSRLVISLCQDEEEQSLIQAECSLVSKEVLLLLQDGFSCFIAPFCVLEDGRLRGKFLGTFDRGTSKRWEFSECCLERAKIQLPQEDIYIQPEEVLFSGVFVWDDTSTILNEKLSFDLVLTRADCMWKGEKVESISAKVCVEEGSLVDTSLQGRWNEAIATLAQRGDAFYLDCKAEWEKEGGGVIPLCLSMDLGGEEGNGTGRFYIQEEEVDVQVCFHHKISPRLLDLLLPWDFEASFQGFFQMQSLSLASLDLFPFQGVIQGCGMFNAKGVQISLEQTDFILMNTPSVQALARIGGEASFAYDYSEGVWKGEIPLEDFSFREKTKGIELKQGRGIFFLEGKQLWTDDWTARLGEFLLSGSLLADEKGVHVASHACQGSLMSLPPPLLGGEALPHLLRQGSVSIKEQGCFIDLWKRGNEWSFEGKGEFDVSEISCDLGKSGRVLDASFHVSFSSQEGKISLSGIQGAYTLGKAGCVFSLTDVSLSPWVESVKPIHFSFIAKDSQREWIRAQGTWEKKEEELIVSFPQQVSILGIGVTLSPLTLNAQEQGIPSMSLSSTVKWKQITPIFSMAQEMGAEIPEAISSYFQEKREESFAVQAVYDSKKSSFFTSVQGDKIAGSLVGARGNFKVESLCIGPYTIQASFARLPKEWKISSFSLEAPEGKLDWKGSYFPDSSQLSVPSFCVMRKEGQVRGSLEGIYSLQGNSFQGKGECRAVLSLNSSLQLESASPILFTVNGSQGIRIGKSNWELKSGSRNKTILGTVSFQSMLYQHEEKGDDFLFQGTGGSLFLSKKAWDAGLAEVCFSEASFLEAGKMQEHLLAMAQDLEAQGEFAISPQQKKIKLVLKQLSYPIQEDNLLLKQTQCLWEQGVLYVSSQATWQESNPFYLQCKLQTKSPMQVQVSFKEALDQPGLLFHVQEKVTPKKGWFFVGAQGTFKGMDLQTQQVKKEYGKNIYQLDLQLDFSQLGPLLPKGLQTLFLQSLGLGPGYTFKGFLTLEEGSLFHNPALAGTISAQEFQCLGKTLKTLTAQVDFLKDQVKLQNIKVQDPAGILSIKALELKKNWKLGVWEMTAPVVYVKDFIPSLFSKKEEQKGVEIKNISLYGLTGLLGKVHSFQGKGALNFSSLEKKPFSFWDVPLSLLKDLGLDLGLLTPVTGELDFILQEGKAYLTELRNAYSEGKRSQFYLAGPAHTSYLSLEGDWYVDLAMKQNVMWKVTEDFIVSIRGTFEKPKYSFHKKAS